MQTDTPRVILVSDDCDLVTYNTFETLAAQGKADVTIAVAEGDTVPETPHCKRLTISAIRSKWTPKARRDLRRAIADTGAQAAFCVSTSALANMLAAAKGTDCKVVGYRGTQAKVKSWDPTYRMALLNKRVAHIVCETPDIEQYMGRYVPPGCLSTLPKPYSLDWVADAMAHPATLDGKGLQICYVGISKGRPHKGLHILLKAMEQVNAAGMECHLTVVGDTDQSLIDSAPANVTFTGNRRDALNFIAAAQLFVLPSLRDASPRVIREAEACGVPCIMTDIPGARDLVITHGPDQTGWLVRPNDPQAVADAILAFANTDDDTRRRLSENARRNIADNYNPQDYVDYFAQLFRRLTAE